ncbi:MAG: hypothetical protein KC561_20875, partial [Myxococcales bacterium]|nr:hypothetical protein [Myxococcales bacterium]
DQREVPMSVRSLKLTAPVLLLTLSLVAAACDEEATEPTPGNNNNNADVSETSQSSEWTPALYRFTSVTVNRPTTVGPVLSGLVNPEIRADRLHILVETASFVESSGATTFEITGQAGEADTESGGYRFQTAVEYVPATVDADGNFTSEETLDINFPVLFRVPPSCEGGCTDNRCASNDDCSEGFTCNLEGDGWCNQDVVVPLREVTIAGTFREEDGEQILRGATLVGAILKSDADSIEVDLFANGNTQPLTNVLEERNLNYPEGSEDPIGWQLSATVSADAVTAAE